MPVIVYKPKRIRFLEKEAFEEFFFAVPISVNYVYADGTKLYIRKIKDFNNSIFAEIEKLTRYPVLIYFNEEDEEDLRLKKSNWPPVVITKDIAIIGTGTISQLERKESFSNLKTMVMTCLRGISQRNPEFLFQSQAKWMIEGILNSSSALVAINARGKVSIFNSLGGKKYKKMWVFDSFLANLTNKRLSYNYMNFID